MNTSTIGTTETIIRNSFVISPSVLPVDNDTNETSNASNMSTRSGVIQTAAAENQAKESLYFILIVVSSVASVVAVIVAVMIPLSYQFIWRRDKNKPSVGEYTNTFAIAYTI